MSQLNGLIKMESYKTFLQHGFRIPSNGSTVQKFQDYERLPTGVFPVDYMMAGGIPLNVLVQLFGPPSGGKNTIALLLAKSMSRFCMRCLVPVMGCSCTAPDIKKTLYVHIGEGRPDGYWPDVLRYDAEEHMLLATPEYGEQAGDLMEESMEYPDLGLIILDSLIGIDSRRGMTESYEKGLMAEAPRLIAKMIKRLNARLLTQYKAGHRMGILVLNQIRANIGGGMFGPSETTAGGWGSKHGYRLSARCSQLAVEKKEMDSSTGLKDSLRFSVSSLGSEAKQQILLLAGKAEYRLNVHDTDELEAGRPIDAKVVIRHAKDLGMFKKVGAKYLFGGDVFASQKSMQMQLQADPDYDAYVKWLVIQEAKRVHVESIGRDRIRRVKTCIGSAASVEKQKITQPKKRKVVLKRRSTSAR